MADLQMTSGEITALIGHGRCGYLINTENIHLKNLKKKEILLTASLTERPHFWQL